VLNFDDFREALRSVNQSIYKHDDPEEFDYVEVATGGVNHRNVVVPLSEVRPPRRAADVYRSVFRFTRDLLVYADDPQRNKRRAETGRPSVSQYDGPATADGLHFELDAEGDLARAQAELWRILQLLEEFGLPAEAIEINFSGHKGFHGFIPAALFGGVEPGPCRVLAARMKRMAELLFSDLQLTSVDWGVYDATRLWRCENTKHSKSGLYSVPVTADEALGPLDVLLRLASEPRSVERPDPNEWLPRPELVRFWEQTGEITAHLTGAFNGAPGRAIEKMPPARIAFHQRHNELVRAAAPLGRLGHTQAEILGLLLVFDRERCDPPMADEGEDEINQIAQWAARLGELRAGPDPEPPEDGEVPEEHDGWCPHCRSRGKALEEEVTSQKASNAENVRARHQIRAIVRNTGLNGERTTALALADIWEMGVRDGHVGPDGFMRVVLAGPNDQPSRGSLAYEAGASPAKVSTDLSRFAQVGLIDEDIREVKRPVKGQRRRIYEHWVRLRYGASAFRAAAARVDMHIPRGAAAHKRCPRCGSEQLETVKRCKACGEVFRDGDTLTQAKLTADVDLDSKLAGSNTLDNAPQVGAQVALDTTPSPQSQAGNCMGGPLCDGAAGDEPESIDIARVSPEDSSNAWPRWPGD
jgi:hypothetical protein